MLFHLVMANFLILFYFIFIFHLALSLGLIHFSYRDNICNVQRNLHFSNLSSKCVQSSYATFNS